MIWIRLGIISAVAVGSFWAGWNWNGARLQAVIDGNLTDYAVQAAKAQKEAVMIVTEGYQARLREEQVIRDGLESASESQAGSIRDLQDKIAKVNKLFAEAKKSPDCQKWADEPIRCDLNDEPDRFSE